LIVIRALEIDILTLFPALCEGAFAVSMMKRAQECGAAVIRVHQLRDWARDKHRTADDTPYGGGQGMVMKPEPIFEAVEALRQPDSRVILLSPQGRVFQQSVAEEYSRRRHLIFICGHYEGIDHRVSEFLADEEISLGDYVLTNGAIAAAVIVDAAVRLLPGVLGHEQSAAQDTFSQTHGGLLEGPQYTRPAEYRGHAVPTVLLSGNHAAIERWRREQGLLRTRQTRPDLLPGENSSATANQPHPDFQAD
jgi:tRNA (guanine37-N1)-methyltransferase